MNAGLGAGVDKVGRYTSQGASDAVNDIAPGKASTGFLQNYGFGVNASWEIDIWKNYGMQKICVIQIFIYC